MNASTSFFDASMMHSSTRPTIEIKLLLKVSPEPCTKMHHFLSFFGPNRDNETWCDKNGCIQSGAQRSTRTTEFPLQLTP